MKILDIHQNTPEWEQLRRTKIGASDCPIIMGKSPFKTPFQLWEEKVLGKRGYVSKSMLHGTQKEPEALSYLRDEKRKKYIPVVVEDDWQIASLDAAIVVKDQVIEFTEIKCPQEETLKKVYSGEIPEYYRWQVQHQLAVTGINIANIMVYNTIVASLPLYMEFPIERDETMIKELRAAEKEFYHRMLDFDPPDALDSDFIDRRDLEWSEACSALIHAVTARKEAEELEKICREGLIYLANDQSSRGCGISLCKVVKRGLVDYKKIPELKGVDLDKYRKSSSIQWRVNID